MQRYGHIIAFSMFHFCSHSIWFMNYVAYPYIEIRNVCNNKLLSWSNGRSAIFPNDWLTNESLYLKKIKPLQDRVLDEDAKALRKVRLMLIGRASLLRFGKHMNVYPIDENSYSCTKENRMPEQRITEPFDDSNEDFEPKKKLEVKKIYQQMIKSCGWDKNCEEQLGKNQLFSYDNEWEKVLLDPPPEQLTEAELNILRKCKESKKVMFENFAKELTKVNQCSNLVSFTFCLNLMPFLVIFI